MNEFINKIILGDCIQVMKQFSSDSIDCIVTDPPYGLGFMGKEWDKALPPKEAFIEMNRVLKPGALAFVMSSPRQDILWRMLRLLEESGFGLKQSFVSWVYASGFPKAYDVSKGIDYKNETPPIKTIEKPYTLPDIRRNGLMISHGKKRLPRYDTEPASDDARKWDGWKSITGLKPALECILMVNKPFSEKTIVDNVLKHGVGAINVDACRIPLNGENIEDFERSVGGFYGKSEIYHNNEKYKNVNYNSTVNGRFPANLLVSDDVLNDVELDDIGQFSRYFDLDAWGRHHGFLNVPKASTSERERGLSGEKKSPKSKFNLNNGSLERFDGKEVKKRVNVHPTVKPIKLMAYLIELGCPRKGIVLDPFVGSGTTCIATKMLGRKYIGIELNNEYCDIANQRVNSINTLLNY